MINIPNIPAVHVFVVDPLKYIFDLVNLTFYLSRINHFPQQQPGEGLGRKGKKVLNS